MLTLNNGRNELWQWDTNRKLTVDADCTQVHFSNKVFGRSIDVDVMDGLAIIPDILLQTDKELTAWAFVGIPENGYTKISKTFKVNRRNKPADYVFTPPDQTSLEEIKEKVEYLESVQDPDAIKNAVEDYLEQNPVEAPVQSVNGKTGTVKLTADDVGAISQDDLQEATNEALAQAKASGEFDGPQGQKGDKGEPGPAGPAGADGQPGEPGADGKTPIKGTDYFTEADKQEIAEQAAQLVEVPEGNTVELDTTLTASGKAADAKAVGDALNGKLSKSGGIMTGKIVFPTADQNVGFTNSGDMKIFGYGTVNGAMHMRMGDTQYPFQIRGNGERAKYNDSEIALMGDIPTDDHINGLINTALGVIENGTY